MYLAPNFLFKPIVMYLPSDISQSAKKLAILGLALLIGNSFFYSPPSIATSISQIPFLSLIVNLIALLIAWQFKQSRVSVSLLILFISECILLVSPLLAFTDFYRHSLIEGMIYSFCFIIMMKDKAPSLGRAFEGVAIFLGMIVLALLVKIAVINAIQSDVAIQVFNTLKISLIFTFAVLALALKPTGNNFTISLFICVFCMLIVHNMVANNFIGLLILSACILNLLVDTYAMAYNDELTGIKGRRALDSDTSSLGTNYTVVMADVDYFKKFNDKYGHSVGDQVLKMVAGKLSAVKGGGKAYRWGGEEFTLLFPNKSPDEVFPFIEEVRQSIADYEFKIRDKNERKKGSEDNRGNVNTSPEIVHVTMSFGATNPAIQQEAFGKVIKRADALLYKAKEDGRNKVVVEESSF